MNPKSFKDYTGFMDKLIGKYENLIDEEKKVMDALYKVLCHPKYPCVCTKQVQCDFCNAHQVFMEVCKPKT